MRSYLHSFCIFKSMLYLGIILNSCSDKDEPQLEIGKTYEGGIIFYIDNSGKHGLVVANRDQGYFQWGCVMTNIFGATGTAVGTGSQNTTDIVAGCSDLEVAACICKNLELNGYSDWFLPSIDELNLMYQNLHKKGLGEFHYEFCIFNYCRDVFYWSSSQYDDLSAWCLYFKTGIRANGNSKNNGGNIRAIRAF